MEQEKIEYFISRYRSLDGDELAELHNRRTNLADEAVAALDAVFLEKGLNANVLERFAEKPMPDAHKEVAVAWKPKIIQGAKVLSLFFVVSVLAKAVTQVMPIWFGALVFLGAGGFWVFKLIRKRSLDKRELQMRHESQSNKY
jgi:hypothetical protein